MKNYIKPGISFQSLELATNIAAGCVYTATLAPAECPVDIPGQPGLSVFQEETGCMLYSPEGNDLICYHVPTADSNVFES
ncbi:MAG: hypothetical protein IKW03_00275 [Clostridia bacterium]|nr:hypothetical protein [Clostridia bacterium]